MNNFTKIAGLGLLSGALMFSSTSFAGKNGDADSGRRDCKNGEQRDGKLGKGDQRGFG